MAATISLVVSAVLSRESSSQDRQSLSSDATKYVFRAHVSSALVALYVLSLFDNRLMAIITNISVARNRVKYSQFRNKKMNTNPSRGPFHQKSPAMMVWRTIRGMVHQKTARGQAALTRLSTFEGIPAPYDKQKRVVVPAALKVMRLKPGRDFTVMGDLAHSVGWKHQDLLKRLESKRKVDGKDFYEKKKAALAKKREAEAACAADLAKVNEVLAAAGY
jgi:large subunit ribosomal protein L13Ae